VGLVVAVVDVPGDVLELGLGDLAVTAGAAGVSPFGFGGKTILVAGLGREPLGEPVGFEEVNAAGGVTVVPEAAIRRFVGRAGAAGGNIFIIAMGLGHPL
jgi:hypothetical protein